MHVKACTICVYMYIVYTYCLHACTCECMHMHRMEDILQPLTEARDLMERLADEEQKKNYERPPGAHVMRGPLLARMEVAKQVILFGMQDMNLQLGQSEGRDVGNLRREKGGRGRKGVGWGGGREREYYE